MKYKNGYKSEQYLIFEVPYDTTVSLEFSASSLYRLRWFVLKTRAQNKCDSALDCLRRKLPKKLGNHARLV